MAAMSMDDILSDAKPQQEEAPPPAEAPAADTPPPQEAEPVERVTSRRAAHRTKELAAQGRAPDGKFLPKEATADEPTKPAEAAAPAPAKPPAQEMTDKERAAFATVADERRKRQALEQRIAELQKTPAPAAGAQPADKKGFWDDPEKALAESHAKTLSEAQQTRIQSKLETSEMLARHRYKDAGDFDANVQVFAELIQQTPGLAQQWLAAADPAEYAYRTGKNHRELREAGGLDAMREKIAKEERVKVEAEIKAKAEKERAERAAIPPSLSDVRGATAQHRPVFAGPTPMTEILFGKG